MLLDALAPRATVRVGLGVLHDNLGDRVHDVLQGPSLLHKVRGLPWGVATIDLKT